MLRLICDLDLIFSKYIILLEHQCESLSSFGENWGRRRIEIFEKLPTNFPKTNLQEIYEFFFH